MKPVRTPALRTELTQRELEVLAAVADGLTRKEVGKRLQISELTVKSHLYRTQQITSKKTMAGQVAWAFRNGLLD